MRILIINYEYPPIGGGGGEVSRVLAESFAEKGHDILVLTAHCGDLPKKKSVGGNLEIRRIFAFRAAADHCTPIRMLAFMMLSIPAARRIAREWRPDIVHCHFAVPVAPVGYYLKRAYNLPFVVTFHGGDVPGHQPAQTNKYFRYIKGIMRHVLVHSSSNIAVSGHLKAQAEAGYKISNVIVIPNGVDVSRYSPPEKRDIPDIRDILFVGRFNQEKNIPVLLKSAGILLERNIGNFHLTLVGAGPCEPEIRRIAEEIKLSDHVEFTGWLPADEVVRRMKRSDFFVLPSITEGMPIACLQAMSSGLAIVGSRVMGIREVVKDGDNGILVEPWDIKGFADAMERLIRDTSLMIRMGKRSREIAFEEFRWEVIVERYLELFRQIVKTSGT